MKPVLLVCALIMGLTLRASAQTSTEKATVEAPKMALKSHTCTEKCHSSGVCQLAHGEQGHTCTEACNIANGNREKMQLKVHECTGACKNGEHVFAHGEQGHTCTEACKI